MRESRSCVLSPDSGSVGGGPGGGVGGATSPSRITDIPPDPPKPKIQAFHQTLGSKRHEDTWKRTPNANGTGAIHMKSFHCKMGDDALQFLDQQINEWLDAHPQYEVKFVSSGTGDFHGKLGKEAHLVIQVWV